MKQNSGKKEKKKLSKGAWIRELLIILLCAVVLAVVVKGFLIDSRQIPSASMVPTIQVGDRVVLWKLPYVFGGQPDQGDIVVFNAPDEMGGKVDLIKRVIGMPGQTVEIKNGYVYIDGVVLEEDYIAEKPQYEFGPVVVPEDHYFVMGDNRNSSVDSHMWEDPFVSIDDIKGEAFFRYWPLSRLGGI